MLAPRSVFVNLADNQVRTTNRFIRYAPLLVFDGPGSPDAAFWPHSNIGAGGHELKS